MAMSPAAAGAVGARTARACDSCLRRRARWYCAADDAFLCQSCDSSVHSANQLARRHERVRLKTASTGSIFKVQADDDVGRDPTAPSWHRGIKRKARTPRNRRQAKGGERPHRRMCPLVPDLEGGALDEEGEEKDEGADLIYRVPVFDHVLAEPSEDGLGGGASTEKTKPPVAATPIEGMAGFLPPDAADFALDVETLLGRGTDRESFCMDDLGFSGSQDAVDPCRSSLEVSIVKKEEETVVGENLDFIGTDLDHSDDIFDINLGCCSPTANEVMDRKRKRLMLSLDYESIINVWSTQRSPWVDDERPRFDGCWLDDPELILEGGGEMGMIGGCHTASAVPTTDAGREARVSRYREKRRTRLFSKKIRYEVRKLNAEKRPRMKGRFVKRASLDATASIGASTTPPPFVF